MKIILILFITLTSLSVHAKFLTFQEFSKLPEKQQVQVLIQYKNFLSAQEIPLGGDERVSLKLFSLIEEASAAAGSDCFFAGWPSKVRASGGKQYCTSPANSNSDYQAQASKCSGSQMLCQPVLFGDVGCIPAATQSQKNMAFASCENKFKSSGKSVADLARELSDPAKRSAADEMFATVSSVCSPGGFQAAKPMCKNLESKVAAIVAARPEAAVAAQTPGETAKADEEVKVETNTEPAGPAKPEGGEAAALVEAVTTAGNVLARPETIQPGHEECIDSEHGHPVAQVARTPALAPVPSKITKATCEPAPLEGIPSSMEELQAELEKNKVRVITSPVNVEYVRAFVAEMRKFPQGLMSDLLSRNAEISLMEGDGVTVDPTFQGKDDSEQMEYRRANPGGIPGPVSWATTPGAGGSIAKGYQPAPTRIVINHLYHGHGSANLFLHEHAHTLDTFDGKHSISESFLWERVINGEDKNKVTELLQAIGSGSGYETRFGGEGFSELFAHYHACEATKEQVTSVAPSVARFFEQLTSIDDFKRREAVARRQQTRPRPQDRE